MKIDQPKVSPDVQNVLEREAPYSNANLDPYNPLSWDSFFVQLIKKIVIRLSIVKEAFRVRLVWGSLQK